MIIPWKLKKWDEIRVIAPSRSLSLLSQDIINLAKDNLEKQGFIVTFSKNCQEKDIFNSSKIESRIEDISEAFKDNNVKAILTVIWWFNSNQLLDYIDYELIKNNPKILCGYSDITALTNAITSQTWLITYSWMHFSTWAMKKEFDYNLEYFNKCLIQEESFEINPSLTWSDDSWYLDQENRDIKNNDWFVIINEWEAEWIIYWWNLCTFNLLQWTKYFPNISNSILFIEDDDLAWKFLSVVFDRDLQSLIHQPNFSKIKGIIIWRFQKNTDMTIEKLRYIINSKKELNNIPIISNVDFWHTNPIITFPIWWTISIYAKNNIVKLNIIKH